MTHTISVVTPAYRPVPQYLTEAYQSLCRQDLPAGWDHAFSMLPPGNNEIHQDYLRERQLIGVAVQSCNHNSNG